MQWEDHAQYLDCLSELLKGMHDRPLIIVGDFNQRIGQASSAPRRLRSALQSVLPEDMTIATAALGHRGRRCIDHMVLSAELVAESLSVIGNMAGERKLSDHSGTSAILSVQSP
jgi:endonuclease/exonuclease/phosphatase family metal-dependent hydrolase